MRDAQRHIYLVLLIGFGILVSLFPFHTWAPEAYASAPGASSNAACGSVKEIWVVRSVATGDSLLPEGAHHWTNLLVVLLLGNIIYVGLVTIAQKRLDWMLGYSSVMHMGYIFLGIASATILSTTGAVVSHLCSWSFDRVCSSRLAGELRKHTGTLVFDELGGLGKVMPFASLAFGFGVFAAIGLPGSRELCRRNHDLFWCV